MEEVVPKMVHRRGSDVRQSRRSWIISCRYFFRHLWFIFCSRKFQQLFQYTN